MTIKFSIWLTEMEQQMNVPDARDFLYIGCVLAAPAGRNYQKALISLANQLFMQHNGASIPQNWSYKAHHMTVKFRPQKADMEIMQPFFGQEVNLTIKSFVADENCAAFELATPALPLRNEIPHITIAHSKKVSANYSNELLQTNKKIAVDYPPVISYCLAVKNDQNKFWPAVDFPLATPVFS